MIQSSFVVSTEPTFEPFTVAEAKAQIRSVQSQEDGLVAAYIKAARQAAETYLGRAICQQTVTASFSDFAWIMPLPMAAPLISVTSVKYYDTNGTQQTLATSVYDVDTLSRPGRVTLKAQQSWPSIQGGRIPNRVEIVYVCGWTTRDLIPEEIRQGMRIYIGTMDVDRDGQSVNTESALRVAKAFWTDRVFPVECG